MLVAEGSIPDGVRECFVQLCGGSSGVVLLIGGGGRAPATKPWEQLDVIDVRSRGITGADALRSDDSLLDWLQADGIWLEELPDPVREDALFHALLVAVLERGGVVAGVADDGAALAAARWSGRGEQRENGLGLLPSSLVHLNHTARDDDALEAALQPGEVGWGVEKSTALVVHHGRRLGAVGSRAISVVIAAEDEWPIRRERFEGQDTVPFGDLPPYDLDLLAWLRSAQQRSGPLFPPKEAPEPRVDRGTLILHGGGKVTDEVFERFIDGAGGKDELLVCIPSAAEVDFGDEPDSYSADELRERGCENVVVLHTHDCRRADEDAPLLELLEDARGVWFDGGRTYRLMDSMQHTRLHRALFGVLRRGGVVGGSSAGAQALGDFLVRGNPRTNRQLEFDGYTTGFGLLPGVVVDAHFRQRDRQDPFLELVDRHSQLLGIGLDEDTAIVVQRTTAEVLGENSVTFYDRAEAAGSKDAGVVQLEDGTAYDLGRRKRRDR